MQLLDRYIYRSVLYGILISTTVLMTLFIFMFYVSELTQVQGNYTGLLALEYSLFGNARMLKELFPMSALIGALIGLGTLSSNSELTVMRATGISIRRIALPVLKVAMLLMVLMSLYSEYLVPVAERHAKQLKADALQRKVILNARSGIWLKNENKIFHAAGVGNNSFTTVQVYQMNDEGDVASIIMAESAKFIDEQWLLYKVKRSDFLQDRIIVNHYEQLAWDIGVRVDIVDVVAVGPSELSIYELWDLIQHLNENDQDSLRYEISLWEKIISPFSTMVMIFMAMPFVFGSLRSVSISTRLLSGTLVGIIFYMANQSSTRLGVVYEITPFISAAAPTLIALSVLIYYSRRLS